MKILLVMCVFLLGCWSANGGLAEQAFRLSKVSQSLKSSVRAKSQCDSGYVHNPFSSTCVRLVKTARSWFGAWFTCQNAGEELLVLNTLESINWFKTLRATNPEWNQKKDIWLGALKTEGQWYWQGRVSQEMKLSNFHNGEPNDSGQCLYDLSENGNGIYFLWDDNTCELSKWFACEKSA